MKSETTAEFRKRFRKLPAGVQAQARQAYGYWRQNPRHPALHFRQIHAIEPVFSVRIGLHYRAVALVEDDVATWFWIGSHSDYDRLIEAL